MTDRPTQGTRPESIGGLLRHTSIYAVAPIVQRLLAVVLVRLYTDRLNEAEWGLLGYTDLFLALFPLLAGTSLVAGLSRHYFVHDDPRDRSSVVSGTAITLAATSTLGVLLVWLFREPIAGLLFVTQGAKPPPEFVDYVMISACVIPFALMTTVGLEALQVEKRSKAVVRITVGKSLFEAALKLYFLFVLDLGVRGFLLCVLIGEAVFGIGLAVFLARRHGTRLVGRTFAPLVKYTLPLVPVGLFQLGLHQSDKFLLKWLGPQNVIGEGADGAPLKVADQWLGIYSLGYQIPFMLHSAAITSFMRIWTPNIFGLRDDAERAPEIRRIGTLVTLGLAAVYAQVAVFGREGVHLLAGNPGLLPAEEVVPWIMLAYLGYGLYALAQAALMSVFATGALAAINLAALVANIALNIVLIPRYGYMGAAGATLISFFLLAALAAARAAASKMSAFEPVRTAAGVAAVTAAAFAGRAIDAETEAWSASSLGLKTIVGIAAIAMTYAALPPELREAARERLRRRRGAGS